MPISQLARLADVATPVIDSVISMASVLAGEDFQRSGRNLESMGWGDFGQAEIRQWTKWDFCHGPLCS